MNDAFHEHEDRELIAEHEAHPERFRRVEILGMDVIVDPNLPPGTAELRDPNTGKIIQTIRVKE